MGMFKSGNVAISEKSFQNLTVTDPSNVMTVRGAVNKVGFLFLMQLNSVHLKKIGCRFV